MGRGIFKKIMNLFLVTVMTLTLIACTSQDQKISGKIELTDQAGRQITLEEAADEIVSCYYITTYACLSLGLGDQIVGLEKKANTRPIYKMAQPSLLDLPQVGSLKELNVEAIAKIEPDLVIMPMKLKDNVKALEDLGITVMVVNPETHDQLIEMITLIGKATGKSEQAQQLTDYYKAKETQMAERSSDTKLNVYMGSNSSYLETAPGSMYQSQLIETAGGVNVAKDLQGDYWTPVSYESLLAMNPDIFIIPVGASYSVDDVMNDKQLSSLKAVQNQAVYQMPQGFEEWDSPVPSGILGTLWLSSILYSENYSFDTFVKDVADFYKTFYGFDIDQTLITRS